ncbi:KH domain [Phytophthora infestans]|uniref:KH domain n=1 Tax=Phytophthora infestans TaxID=4787 RepID=A0A833WB08_PHYIN|nr:KH domain [Phytophthora infestans]KAF4138073.1 KH domain [Phytophthora infestans]KAI9980867.1 hypothetical protein PInf_010204 [Phytophthora infestans]
MSFSNTHESVASRRTSLSIPDHVPIGIVIGRGGRNCKTLEKRHGVQCFVDKTDQKVTLSGPTIGVDSAESQLIALFSSYGVSKLENKRVFEVAVRDGPQRLWSFQKDDTISSNTQIETYRYRLRQSGAADATANIEGSWIKEFREEDMHNLMSYLDKEQSESPYKIEVSFGELCFKLKALRCSKPSMSWSVLQKLCKYRDFRTRWTNFCGSRSPSMVALLGKLEDKVEKEMPPIASLSVQLTGCLAQNYDLKYHLVGGQWILHNVRGQRCVGGTYDVLLDDDLSFRVRAAKREGISDNILENIQRLLVISIPESGNFFDTKVTLSRPTPPGVTVNFKAKSKVHVETNGLHFAVSYLDPIKNEFRLECRLSKKEKTGLGSSDNEARILVEKVLQVTKF